jgi:hypothetical protein
MKVVDENTWSSTNPGRWTGRHSGIFHISRGLIFKCGSRRSEPRRRSHGSKRFCISCCKARHTLPRCSNAIRFPRRRRSTCGRCFMITNSRARGRKPRAVAGGGSDLPECITRQLRMLCRSRLCHLGTVCSTPSGARASSHGITWPVAAALS